MDQLWLMINKTIIDNPLISAFAFVGLIIWLSNYLARHVTGGRVAGSAIAVLSGLALAYIGGFLTGKSKGLADIAQFGGLALMGGAMMRDFTIVATASEVHIDEAKKAGWLGVIALVLGTILPFIAGVGVAYAFGYRDPIALTTIGAGAITYIVGPVTGAAIGASSDVMALSIATGVVKAIMVMVMTPALARFMHLNNPQAAMVFGGLAGTVSGVSAGLAATDRRLVPYGALVATFHTGFGCLLGPSVLYLTTRALF
jgi:malonate transporter MadM subunit